MTASESDVQPTATLTASDTTNTTKPAASATTTKKPTSTTTRKPTPGPTSTPTAKPAATPTPTPSGGSFPYRNYGAFFRDEYGSNSEITQSPDGGISIDTGCAPNGVALVKVDSIPSDKRCKVIASANGATYQYDLLTRSNFVGIPLQMGNGSYTITVYEQVSGTSYTPKLAHTFSVTLASTLKPYTAASIMTDFSHGSACVQKASSLCSGISTSTGKVDAVYRWIVGNISYDRDLANSISSGTVKTYIPSPDKTFSSKKGICFDYASLMCAMLRSQGIPTRLVVGSTPLGYHAWNEVYFAGQGWVVVASFKWKEIDGSGWVLFDTTFAAGGMSAASIQSTTHTKQKTY